MIFTKTKLALGVATATLTMAGALVSPQAAAHSKAERVAEAANNRAEALEAQMNQMSQMMQSMQAELDRVKAESGRPVAESEKVQELDQWMASVKSAPVEEKHHDNTIFFRGGFARNDVKRNDLFTGNQFAGNALGGDRTNKDGWYVGAGFDFGLTDNVWGAMDNTQVLAELMFDFKNFGAKDFKGAAPGATPGTVGANPTCTLINLAAADTVAAGQAGTANCKGVTVTQLSVSAAPKIKFMQGSKFRPWIIPVGLAVHVISPPSNGATYINPGMMFGTGADYKLWKDIYLGADVRYNLTGRSVDGVNIDGMTAGGYLGIGF